MKRTPLQRKTPLARTAKASPSRPRQSATGLKTTKAGKPPAASTPELRAAEAHWKLRRTGRCSACGVQGPLIWHHIVYEQLVIKARRPEMRWDPRNALPLGAPVPWGGRCRCHDNHHAGGDGKLPFSLIKREALDFAYEVLGVGPAVNFFARRYAMALTNKPGTKGEGCQ